MKKAKFIAVPAAALLLTGCGSASSSSDTNVPDHYASTAVDNTSASDSKKTSDTSNDDIDIDLTNAEMKLLCERMIPDGKNDALQRHSPNLTISSSESLSPKVALVSINCISFRPSIAFTRFIRVPTSIPFAPE